MDPAVPGLCIIGFVLLGWLVQLLWTFFEPMDPYLDYLIPMQGDFQVVHATWGDLFREYVGNPCSRLYRKLVDLSVIYFPAPWNAFNYYYLTDFAEWERGIVENAVLYYVSRILYFLEGEGQ
jgi:hypothetical protein